MDKLKQKLSDFIQFCKKCSCCCNREPDIEIVHLTHQQAHGQSKPYYNRKIYTSFDNITTNEKNSNDNIWDCDIESQNNNEKINNKKINLNDDKSYLNNLSETNPFKYGTTDDDNDDEDTIYINEDYFY